MSLPITSVSKRPQKLSDAAAAVFVITQEDIRRSGATSIPELLRMVPGVEVAREDANQWAVTARGFNGRFANKLLVLFDGRTVYNPLFSGVFWDQQNYILEDIERIEVIRGPGASLWGANAVNGVINIITKKAKDTQGGLVSAAYGSREAFSGVRYGAKLGDSTFYRVYSRYHDNFGFPGARGIQRDDSWNYSVSGFRLDSRPKCDDSLTVIGDFQNRDINETYLFPSLTAPGFADRLDTGKNVLSGDALARWEHVLSPTSNIQFQAYYDHLDMDDPLFSELENTVDFELQHQFRLGEKHTLMWGVGYRYEEDSTWGSPTLDVAPGHRNSVFSAFVQDEIKLAEKFGLVLGSRFEHNNHTGFEVQPTARLLWRPDANQSVWAAVSRAVRTPSWSEEDFRLVESVVGNRTLARLIGNPSFASEKLVAYELGYRFMPKEHLSIDIAGFYNQYDNLRTVEPGNVFAEGSHFVLPLYETNGLSGHTYGFELAADYQVLKWWRLQAGYTFLQMNLGPDSPVAGQWEGSNPHHQLSVRSWLDLPHNTEFDLWFRFVDELPAVNVSGYATMDARLAWKPVKNLELSLVGQNLLAQKHIELTPDFTTTIEAQIERSVYGKIVWRF